MHYLYCCGTDGEMYHLSAAERKQVTEAVVRTAQGRVVVYGHCGAMKEGDTLELVRHAQSIGADGVSVVTPSYYPTTDREMEWYYVNIANTVAYFKEGLNIRGLDVGTMRVPLLGLDRTQSQQWRAKLERIADTYGIPLRLYE